MAKKIGRPPLYNPERVEIICNAIANGDSVEVVCAKVGITPSTFYDWQDKFPEFSQAVKDARKIYDDWKLDGILEDARKSLKVLICGQDYEEVKTTYEPQRDGTPKIKLQTRTTKKIAPNATAIIFALCNRDPEHWQNRVVQDGKIELEQKPKVSLDNVPDELLMQVAEAMNLK